MNSKTLRSLSLGTITLSQQFGIKITAEQLEQKISRGQIVSERELKSSLGEQSIKLQRLKELSTEIEDSIEKGKNLVGKNEHFKKIKIDDRFPNYITGNLEKFNQWII